MSIRSQLESTASIGDSELLRTKHIKTLEVLNTTVKEVDRLKLENDALRKKLAIYSELGDQHERILALEAQLKEETTKNQQLQRDANLNNQLHRHTNSEVQASSNSAAQHERHLFELRDSVRQLKEKHAEELDARDSMLNARDKQLLEIESELQRTVTALKQAQSRIAELQLKLEIAVKEREHFEAAAAMASAQPTDVVSMQDYLILQQNANDCHAALQTLQNAHNDLQSQMFDYSTAFEQAKQNFDAERQSLVSKYQESDLTHARLTKERDALRDKLNSAPSAFASQMNEKDVLISQLQSMLQISEAEIHRLRSECDSGSQSQIALRSQIAAQAAQLRALQAALKQSQSHDSAHTITIASRKVQFSEYVAVKRRLEEMMIERDSFEQQLIMERERQRLIVLRPDPPAGSAAATAAAATARNKSASVSRSSSRSSINVATNTATAPEAPPPPPHTYTTALINSSTSSESNSAHSSPYMGAVPAASGSDGGGGTLLMPMGRSRSAPNGTGEEKFDSSYSLPPVVASIQAAAPSAAAVSSSSSSYKLPAHQAHQFTGSDYFSHSTKQMTSTPAHSYGKQHSKHYHPHHLQQQQLLQPYQFNEAAAIVENSVPHTPPPAPTNIHIASPFPSNHKSAKPPASKSKR